MKRRAWLTVVVAGLSLAAPPRPEACINAIQLSRDEAVRMVAKAEALIDAGKDADALAVLDGTGELRGGGNFRYDAGSQALQAKAELLAATAMLRAGDAAERQRARKQLEQRLKVETDTPLLIARVAEARAGGSDEDRRLALAALDELERRDLMPDAEAYAALSRLRAAAKDTDGAARAAERCALIARRPGVCPATGQDRPVRPAALARRRLG